jgi:hypothetical protein
LLHGEHARLLVQRAYTDITQGDLVDTYARSAFGQARREFALSCGRPLGALSARGP